MLRPGTLVQEVHAVLLTGGSAFGLAAADGVARWLEERGVGFDAGVARVPIVPAAVLFDLGVGDPAAPARAAAGGTPRARPRPTATSPRGRSAPAPGATVAKIPQPDRAGRAASGRAAVEDGAVVGGRSPP